MTSTGRTSHQIGCVLTRWSSTTWLWFGVGTKIGAIGGPVFPSANRVLDRSTVDECMVQVPATGLFGSGHCVVMAGLTLFFQASGISPKKVIKAFPRAGPHSSPGLGLLGHGIASLGFVSWSTENIGTST